MYICTHIYSVTYRVCTIYVLYMYISIIYIYICIYTYIYIYVFPYNRVEPSGMSPDRLSLLFRYQEMAGRHRADPGSIQIIHARGSGGHGIGTPTKGFQRGPMQ